MGFDVLELERNIKCCVNIDVGLRIIDLFSDYLGMKCRIELHKTTSTFTNDVLAVNNGCCNAISKSRAGNSINY